MLASEADPVHPARIYGELLKVLDDDAVVIGDGGDFVSFAGKYIEPLRPGGWLDPGPFGCLGTGLGYAIAARVARPSAQVVLLLGDGAAGFSLMDADTLVRHGLPVVMVCGNNAGWGLERHPMRALYGYDVAADLQPGCRYDEVVRALGGAGELVTKAADIGPAGDNSVHAGETLSITGLLVFEEGGSPELKLESGGLLQRLKFSGEMQRARAESASQRVQKLLPEQATEHAHRKEEGLAARDPATVPEGCSRPAWRPGVRCPEPRVTSSSPRPTGSGWQAAEG